MLELAVWRPDAFVDPDDYVAHVNLGLRALRRTARGDTRLAMTVDEERRPLIELLCVRTPGRSVPALVASLPDPAADGPTEHPVFPATPAPERLTDLGWDAFALGQVRAWALGPVAGFDGALETLGSRVVATLQEFACPLGFVDLRLQQLVPSPAGFG